LGFNRNPVGVLGITSNAVPELSVFSFRKISYDFVEPTLNIWRRFYPLDPIAKHEFAIVAHAIYMALKSIFTTAS